ncbi:hypothetical protein SRABI26_02027 [Arthrobacter sp. Bi26]|uniref:hypothetical protein n=1 Tax=Arthrobacter sp. Bi26 TaxID=2822350 RepID=UPI001DA3552B|nr:hypothetical protein [Arthrobacter sp. Bi26]CAH0205496.1 hypothetical protein SRABI26_02027 [Arthrobacter sp. Bi26]
MTKLHGVQNAAPQGGSIRAAGGLGVDLLAVLRLRARDLVGFTFLQFVFHLPVVLLLVWLLGMTFEFVPPVIPK